MREYNVTSSIKAPCSAWFSDEPTKAFTGSLICRNGRTEFTTSPIFSTSADEAVDMARRAFSPRFEESRPQVVHGQTVEFAYTLLGARKISELGGVNLPKEFTLTWTRYIGDAVLVGMHISSEEAPVIEQASYRFGAISQWLPTTKQIALTDDAYKVLVPTDPNVITTFSSLPLACEIRLESFSVVKGKARSSTKIKRGSQLTVVPRHPQSLRWFVDLGLRLENYFSIVLGTKVPLKKLRVVRNRETGWLIKAQNFSKEAPDHKLWIGCSPERLSFSLATWLASSKDQQRFENILLGTLRKRSLFLETEFLALSQALEAFSRFQLKLSDKKHISFKSRLQAICELLSTAFKAAMLGAVEDFVLKIVDTRNYYTHPGLNKQHAVTSARELFELNQTLHAFLRSAQLLHMGLPEESIRTVALSQATRRRVI